MSLLSFTDSPKVLLHFILINLFVKLSFIIWDFLFVTRYFSKHIRFWVFLILNIGIVEPIFQPQLSRAQDKISIVCAFISSAVIEVLLHVIMCVKKYNRIYTFYLFMNSGELEQRARSRGEGQWKLLGVFFYFLLSLAISVVSVSLKWYGNRSRYHES